MSSAVLNWRLWSEPDAFLKMCFSFRCARRVIIIANLRSVPPRLRPFLAASFADFTTNALIASFTLSPRRNPNLDGERP